MSLYDAAKDAFRLAQKADNIELQQQLIQVQAQALELQEENERLQHKLGELQKILEFQEQLTFDGKLYWSEGDDAPFCSNCWDTKRTAVHVHPNGMRAFSCPNCENSLVHEKAPSGRRPFA